MARSTHKRTKEQSHQPEQTPPPQGPASEPETVTLDRDKIFRLAYRIVMAQGVRMSPNEAKRHVEDALGIKWETVKMYVMNNPR